MPVIDPDHMRLDYRCQYRGIPGRYHDREDFPMNWNVSIDDDGSGGHVGGAQLSIVLDAGIIDLPMTMAAAGQSMADVADMLTTQRPDLMPNAGMDRGGDLLVLTALWVDPQFRGHRIGHAILKAILGTVGRSAALVVLQAVPGGGAEEGTPGHTGAKAALRRYWLDFGFQEAAGDYLVLAEMSDAFNP